MRRSSGAQGCQVQKENGETGLTGFGRLSLDASQCLKFQNATRSKNLLGAPGLTTRSNVRY